MARKQAIAELDRAVAEAVRFFEHADADLFDDRQSARDVISHLVFWHREYVSIANALTHRRAPRLKTGKFREFNALATQMFARQSLPRQAQRLAGLQRQLAAALQRLEDWRKEFPFKQGVKYCSVNKRVLDISAHINSHVKRLRRAERRKERLA